MNELSNNSASVVDLTESSLEDILNHLRPKAGESYVLRPTRFVVPPWVLEEIEAQYGAPATEAKYHRWNMKRLNLDEAAYWAIVCS